MTNLAVWWPCNEGSGAVAYGYDAQNAYTASASTKTALISQTASAVNSSIYWSIPFNGTGVYDNGTWRWSLAAGNSTTWRVNGTTAQTIYLLGVNENAIVQYYVTYVPGSGGTLNQSSGFVNNATVVTVLATPSVGWAFQTFNNNNTGNSTSNPLTFTVTQNVTITAYWTSTLITFGSNTTFQLTNSVLITFQSGFTFLNLTVNSINITACNVTNCQTYAPSNNIFVLVNWNTQPDNTWAWVTFANDGHGTVNENTGWYALSQSVSVLATSNGGGYLFLNFVDSTNGNSTNNPYSFTPTQNMTVTAYFLHEVYLTFLTGNGIVALSQSTGWFPYQVAVSVTATAGTNYGFSYFFDTQVPSNIYSNPYIFTPAENRTIEAYAAYMGPTTNNGGVQQNSYSVSFSTPPVTVSLNGSAIAIVIVESQLSGYQLNGVQVSPSFPWVRFTGTLPLTLTENNSLPFSVTPLMVTPGNYSVPVTFTVRDPTGMVTSQTVSIPVDVKATTVGGSVPANLLILGILLVLVLAFMKPTPRKKAK